jgi:hypothetical protein
MLFGQPFFRQLLRQPKLQSNIGIDTKIKISKKLLKKYK